MKKKEIYRRLLKLRNELITQGEAPLSEVQNAMLYDVALHLGLGYKNAATVAGDAKPPRKIK